jgi:quercetin dioxygenase-like cupin family protein
MKYQFPHIIENCIGERIEFLELVDTPDGGKAIVESFCQPGCGPVMHTHFKQSEGLTVLSGIMGYQVQGEKPRFIYAGESVEFNRGIPHKFWAEGNEVLHCKGWIQPANTIVFYLTAVYAAQNKSGSGRPETFDAAYLLTRYAAEYDLVEMPRFVKKVIMPATYFVGKILGKYKHFKNAPAPVAG